MNIETTICELLGLPPGARIVKSAQLQELWSGYGSIDRYSILGDSISDQSGRDILRKSEHDTFDTLIAKHVKLPSDSSSEGLHHPRGWATALSHRRKAQSYEVERHWYQRYAMQCGEDCRIARSYAATSLDADTIILLEDLDASGYDLRLSTASIEQMLACLKWLAAFHATFMGQEPYGLWPTGTYWHLETRPDELRALEDIPLREAAPVIDKALSIGAFQTLVHGDAKLANFCFSNTQKTVAAVDFQYVGRGCGMKDVAYFIGSCLEEKACEDHEQLLLDSYFQFLNSSLKRHQSSINPDTVEQEWRPLYAVAWADFHRFIKGWSPGHWKIHDYSERMTREVIAKLAH